MHTSRFFQRVLEYLATHACVDHRVPVLQLYSTRSQCLRKLVHGRTGLLTGRARYSCKVGDTLDGRDRCIQINTCRRKSTNITGHFRKIVDCQVSVVVQFVQRSIDLVQRSTFTRRVRQNRLNRIDLGFVFLKATNDGVKRQSLYKSFSGRDGFVGNVGQCRNGNYINGRKLALDRLQCSGHFRKIDLLGGRANALKPFFYAFELK